MITIEMLLRSVDGLRETELRAWIAQDLVRPAGDPPRFSDLDAARVRLIRELRHDLEVEEATLPVVLSLLDQLYRERARLRRLCDALERHAAPEQLRVLLNAIASDSA